jgi:hypothetical protein
MAWVLSATSCLMLWLMGNNSKWGPRLGLANQALWLIYCLRTGQIGLLPGAVAYAVIHARNLVLWNKRSTAS